MLLYSFLVTVNMSHGSNMTKNTVTHYNIFCFLDRAFSIMKTKIKQQNAQINSGLIYY